MRRYVAALFLVVALVSLLASAAASDVRPARTLEELSDEADRYDLYLGADQSVRMEPVQGRLIGQSKLVDTDSGVETILPAPWYGRSFDNGRIVLCLLSRFVVFDLATDSIVHDLWPAGLPAAYHQCDLRDGKIYASNDAGVLIIDPTDSSTQLLTFPGQPALQVHAGYGAEDGMLHVSSGTSYYDIDLAAPSVLIGPRPPRRNVAPHTGTTYDVVDPVIIEYDRHGTAVRTFPCPGSDGCWPIGDVYPLDADRAVAYMRGYLQVVNLTTGWVSASARADGYVDLVDDDYLYLKTGREVVRVDRDAAFITEAPDLLDARTSAPARIRTWSLFEPVAVSVNGIDTPFTRVPTGVDIDVSNVASGPLPVSVTFANGATTSPVVVEAIAAPTFESITVTGHDLPDEHHSASISMSCSGVYSRFESKTVSSGQTVPFQVPVGSSCEATASGGRFGPLVHGFVVDYSTSWPDPDLPDESDDWHVWVGADNQYPVHWVIAGSTGGPAEERPATLRCGLLASESWQGTIAYGQWTRFVRDFRPNSGANRCDWSFDEVPGFDGTDAVTFGPITEIPYVYHGDSSTLTIVDDYFLHPDTSDAAFLNAINRRANGRTSTTGELNWWTPRLAEGGHVRGIAVDAIVTGQEYRSRAEPIARLYQAYFDRLPDASGLEYWTNVASRGTSLLEISRYFAQSVEFQRKIGEADSGRFVLLAYENVLGRIPDEGGYQYWLDALDTGALDGPGVMFYFSDGPEFRSAMRERLAVSGTYNVVLNRAPTDAEVTSGIELLRSTGSLAILANRLFARPDYDASFVGHRRL